MIARQVFTTISSPTSANATPEIMLIVLSAAQAQLLLDARTPASTRVLVSPDLGRSQCEALVSAGGVQWPDGTLTAWEEIAQIVAHPQVCFLLTAQGASKIQRFSPAFNRLYSLMPTGGAPTLLISGIPMHRIKATDPWADTQAKIRAAAPRGRVLDTATGLGYTAIMAAQRAEQVTTIELDPTVLEVAKLNPWSQPLFAAENIEQKLGDAFDVIETLPDQAFDCIIHDPPMFNLAGHLYSAAFYKELRRVLKQKGRLFHYIGDPASKSGRNITRGVRQRLQQAGFRRLQRAPQAFGVIAFPG